MLLILLSLGCGEKNTLPPSALSDDTGGAEEVLSAGLVSIEGGTFPLGEPDALTVHEFNGGGVEVQTIIPVATFTVEDFQMDRYPFPGEPGLSWFSDGLTHGQVAALSAQLQQFGRRVCTITELLYAASGKENFRYPYGDGSYNHSACEPDDVNPGLIGSHPLCVSPMGIRDFQVRSTWARLDERILEVMAETPQAADFPEAYTFGAWGGTSRTDTFYSPNNYGFHLHAADEVDAYLDDGFRICADAEGPSEDQQLAFEWWLEDVAGLGSYEALFE